MKTILLIYLTVILLAGVQCSNSEKKASHNSEKTFTEETTTEEPLINRIFTSISKMESGDDGTTLYAVKEKSQLMARFKLDHERDTIFLWDKISHFESPSYIIWNKRKIMTGNEEERAYRYPYSHDLISNKIIDCVNDRKILSLREELVEKNMDKSRNYIFIIKTDGNDYEIEQLKF